MSELSAPTPLPQFLGAQRVFDIAQKARTDDEQDKSSWEVVFDVTPEEYNEIDRCVMKNEELWDHVKPKIRLYYNHVERYIGVCTLCPRHRFYLEELGNEVKSFLHTTGEGSGPAADFARQVNPRNTPVPIPMTISGRNGPYVITKFYLPDIAFQHEKADRPGVIFELWSGLTPWNTSCKPSNAIGKAYLDPSNTDVQVTVCGYSSPRELRRKGSFFVWHSAYRNSDGDDSDTGEPVLAEDIELYTGPENVDGFILRLSDFAPADLTRDFKGSEDEPELHISLIRLKTLLLSAEMRADEARTPGGVVPA